MRTILVTSATLALDFLPTATKLVTTEINCGSKPHSSNSSNIISEQIFTQLATQPWAMWLDSCDSQHPDSRYDIMVWQPMATLTYSQAEHSIVTNTDTKQSVTSTEDPLALLESIQQHLFKNNTNNNYKLPFYGGALGYFGYDLGRRFEHLPTTAKQDIKQPDLAIGFYQQAIVFDRAQQALYLVSSRDKQAELAAWLEQVLHHPIPAAKGFKLTCTWQANMSKQEYQGKFQQVQEYLLSGDCYQINLAQRFQAQYQGDEFHAYQALRAKNQAPFSAFIRLPDSCILSISPERFLQVKDRQVQTKPIKGTRPRYQDFKRDQAEAEVLQQSSKDRAENLMIVDLLRNDLSKVCQPSSVKVPHLFTIESFPAVHHLVSTVEGELEPEHSACDLLRGAFPGGSITGAPKIRAMEIIEQLEPHRRNLYCGSIGYLSACGNMDTSITIRTLVCEQDSIYCWAGGGLVADSQVACEYQETFDKVQKILPVLTELE